MINSSFEIPIVLFCFKRIESTIRVIKAISAVKPSTIYLISDAGRNEEEHQMVLKCRTEIENSIDWDCKIIKNYALENRGVFENIGMGSRWVFEHEEMAIFLEDDNLPEETFFAYCRDLLYKYKDNDRILWICGTNYFEDNSNENCYSYYFTRNLLPCGWASWKDKFLKYYDYSLTNLESKNHLKVFKESYINKALYKQQLFNVQGEKSRMNSQKKCISWDSQMAFSIRSSGRFGIVPVKNQIINIGVDEFSTHGGNSFDSEMTRRFCGMGSQKLDMPLKHPQSINLDTSFEDKLEKYILYPFDVRLKGIVVRMIKRFFFLNLYEPLGLKQSIKKVLRIKG